MVRTDVIRGKIAEKGLTLAEAAKMAGISYTAFNRRMKGGAFGTDEAQRLIEGLGIENPADIFFAKG